MASITNPPSDSLRREDAANRCVALSWLAAGDYRRARGWARLLINDDHRRQLQLQMADQMPAKARADLMHDLAEEDKAKEEESKRRKWSASTSGTHRRVKAKSGAAVPIIEPSEALAGDLSRLLARKMKYEKGSA